MTVHAVHCRICAPLCGLLVTVEDGRAVHVAGDPDHALTRGFTCAKGRRLAELHHAPERFLTAQRRDANALVPVATDRAIDEIAARLSAIRAEHGPQAIALFVGTQAYTASLTYAFAGAWLRAVGSHQRFSTMTIDQSAKWVAQTRLGRWGGGRQRFEDSDVWLLAGTNPLVSMQGADLTGFPVHDGLRRLRDARARGLRLIVVDPRRTEVAEHADVHLQLVPGTDVVLYAALLHVILSESRHDAEFCARWADGLGALRDAVAPMTPAVAAEVCGLAEDAIVEAARLFADGPRGMATSGTGPDMGPYAEVAEHLLQAMNVVCGRFPRAGDRYAGSSVLSGARTLRAEAFRPVRPDERTVRSRGGVPALMGEIPSPLLPDEILCNAPDRIRALVVAGGNPAVAFPDPDRIVEALRALDLLVTVDPFPSETARLAHYVIAPTMQFERPDDTRGNEAAYSEHFAQSSPPILARPGDVVEDWEFFFDLAQRMGLLLNIGNRVWEPGDPRPSSREMLESMASRARVSYDAVADAPHGAVFDDLEPVVIGPARDRVNARFELLAPDVAAQLREALDACRSSRAHVRAGRPFLLVVRRAKDTMNSLGRRVGDDVRTNPCFVHPDDLSVLGLHDGATVRITSDHGAVRAVVRGDATLRRGVAALTHCYGGLPEDGDDPARLGTSASRLLSLRDGLQPVSRMPHLSAVPVSIAAAPS